MLVIERKCCMDLFSVYLGINGGLHDLSISVPGDLCSRFGSWGSAGEIVWRVGLETYDRAAFHHGVRGSNCSAKQTVCRPLGKNWRKTAIELVVSLSSASIHDKNCQVSVNKMWFYTRDKTKNSCYFTRKVKRNTQLYLFPFSGLTLLVYLLLPWRSDVAAELRLNCLFVHLFAWFRTHHRQAKRATPDEGVHLPRTNKRRRKHGGLCWPFSHPPPNQFHCVYLNCQRSFRCSSTDTNGIRVLGDFNFHADSPDCTPTVDSFDCVQDCFGFIWPHWFIHSLSHTYTHGRAPSFFSAWSHKLQADFIYMSVSHI